MLNADSTVATRPVTVERAEDEFTILSQGLEPGETVVTDGQLRLLAGREGDGQEMNLSAPWIKRPVMTTLVMVGILIFGIVGYTRLPVSDVPNVDYPVISVSASLPGASPETMASAVAAPLEKQFTTIAGLDAMTSSSTTGSTNITLQFTLDRDIDAAAQDVQAAMAKTLRSLPTGIVPPSYQKVNPADSPILFLAMTSPLCRCPSSTSMPRTCSRSASRRSRASRP